MQTLSLRIIPQRDYLVFWSKPASPLGVLFHFVLPGSWNSRQRSCIFLRFEWGRQIGSNVDYFPRLRLLSSTLYSCEEAFILDLKLNRQIALDVFCDHRNLPNSLKYVAIIILTLVTRWIYGYERRTFWQINHQIPIYTTSCPFNSI